MCRDRCRLAIAVGMLVLSIVATTTAVERGSARMSAAPDVEFDVDAPPAHVLGEHHFFIDAARQVPNRRVVPYELNTPHFADYARLHRFVWLPAGERIHSDDGGALEFPVGAVLIITVGYLEDIRDPDSHERIIETRLFVHRRDGWEGLQYVWNDDTSEARLSVVGTRAEVSWTHYDGSRRTHTYLAPNRNECKQCHEIDGVSQPLGPVELRQINRDYAYADGVENQLTHWTHIGYLSGAPHDPANAERIPVWNDPTTGTLNQRARAYLAMNCSSCHRPRGLAITSGLDLSYDQREPVRYGVFKAPVAAGRGAGNGRFAIEPGRPEHSILTFRLQTTDPGMRMPIVGRGIAHDEGVALIEEWIAAMDFPQMAADQAAADRLRDALWNDASGAPTDHTDLKQ